MRLVYRNPLAFNTIISANFIGISEWRLDGNYQNHILFKVVFVFLLIYFVIIISVLIDWQHLASDMTKKLSLLLETSIEDTRT